MKAHWIITIATVAGIGLFAGAFPLGAQQAYQQAGTKGQEGQLSHKDFKFLEDASRGGMEEVQLGQLATQKAANPAVRDFGQRMVNDHNKANDELRQLSAQKGAALPTQISHLENFRVEHLQKLSGADFDQAYVKDMVKDHRKDVKDFESAAKDLSDPDLRAWAQKTLPVLQQHLQAAENLEATVKTQK